MSSNSNLTPVKLWILILATITVVTLLVFTGIKLFSQNDNISIRKSPSSYTFASVACNVTFDAQSEQFSTDDKCWNVKGNNIAWFMICNSPKVGDMGRAVEVRAYFLQGKYTHMYAYDLWQKRMNYSLKDFAKDIADGRITKCMYQYPMSLPTK